MRNTSELSTHAHQRLAHFIGGQGVRTRAIRTSSALYDLVFKAFGLSIGDFGSPEKLLAAVEELGPSERRRLAHLSLESGALSIGQRAKKQRRKAEKVRAKRVAARLNVLARRSARSSSVSEDTLRSFYDSWEWKRLSYETRQRRGMRCECCGATPAHGVRIVCDHIKPIRHHWHLRLNADNLQALCDDCNKGKGHWDETDWRAERRSPQPDDNFERLELEAQGFIH